MLSIVRQLTLLLCFASQPGLSAEDIADRPWRHYQSAHFSIYSDVRPRRAARTIAALETFWAGVHHLTQADPTTSPQHETRLYLFKRLEDLRKLHANRQVLGFMTPGLRYNLMVAAQPPRSSILNSQNAVVFHEYVHQLVRSLSSFRYPTWYDEGFAELLSTAQLGRRGLIFGQAPQAALKMLELEPQMPLAEMLSYREGAKENTRRRQRFYAKAWLFTHYLLFSAESKRNNYTEASREYLRAYDQGQRDATTFAQYFKQSPAEMDLALREYPKRVQSFEVPYDILAVNPKHEQRRLSADEARYALGSMFVGRNDETAQTLLRKVKPESPTYARSLSALGEIDTNNERYSKALERQRQSLTLRPDDYLLHLALAETLMRSCPKQAHDCDATAARAQALDHYAQAHELAPNRADTLAPYGQALMQQDYSREALPLLQQAQSLVPGNYQLVLNVGLAHLQNRQWQAAEYFLQRAWGWSSDIDNAQERISELLKLVVNARQIEADSLYMEPVDRDDD